LVVSDGTSNFNPRTTRKGNMNPIVKEAIASEIVRIIRIKGAYTENSWVCTGDSVLDYDTNVNRIRVLQSCKAGRVAAWPAAAACEWLQKNGPEWLRRV